MPTDIDENTRARIAIVMRYYLATGQDLEAALAFDKSVCDALEIDHVAEPPLFLTDPSVLE